MKLPDNYQTVMPYLIVEGAAKFIEFTKNVFDAKETHNEARSEEVIRHAEIMIGGSTIMLADATDQFASKPAGMFIYVEDVDATYEKAIEHGAASLMPPAEQGYGRSCGVLDTFGNTWWITTPKSN